MFNGYEFWMPIYNGLWVKEIFIRRSGDLETQV
jgi:hypothetical protein